MQHTLSLKKNQKEHQPSLAILSIRYKSIGGSLLLLASAFVSTRALGESTGNNLTLAWDAHPQGESQSYRVYYGASSQIYTDHVDFGEVTTASFYDLSGGTKYFAISAISQAGIESGFSNEICFRSGPPVIQISFSPQGTLITVKGTTGRSHVIEASADLIKWEELVTVVLGPSGSADFVDLGGSSDASRFYRTIIL